MPGKSQRRRVKYSPQSKKRKGRLNQQTVLAQSPAVAQVPISSPNPPVPKASMSTPKAEPIAIRYPYIDSELRTTGILAGTMLIFLIVLALAFS